MSAAKSQAQTTNITEIYENSSSGKKLLNVKNNNESSTTVMSLINEQQMDLASAAASAPTNVVELTTTTSATNEPNKMNLVNNNNTNNNINKDHVQNNLMMNHKDALYATPLRKSERHKHRTGERIYVKNTNSSNNNNINNLDEKINNLNFKNNNSGDSNDKELRQLIDRSYLNSELGDIRIRDFLKDTAHMHKKMDLMQNKEHINASFSHLARKEHFVNLVHQNVLNDSNSSSDHVEVASSNENNETANEDKDLINLGESNEMNMEHSEKLINKLTDMQNIPSTSGPNAGGRLLHSHLSINLNREWVLKKIAVSLEQRSFKKPPPSLPDEGLLGAKSILSGIAQQNANLPTFGYLVLGSNGSGKTTICNDILNGGNGTKGMLHRRLIAFYFVNSQNPECHSLSIFIRNIVLQILSFSSMWMKKSNPTSPKDKDDEKMERLQEELKNMNLDRLCTDKGDSNSPSSIVDKELEEMILSEIKLNERVAEFCSKKSKITRQQSEPLKDPPEEQDQKYTTHPPLQKQIDKMTEKSSPTKKVSKIPVKINGHKVPKMQQQQQNETIQTGGGEGIADINDQTLEEDIAKELNKDKDSEMTDKDKNSSAKRSKSLSRSSKGSKEKLGEETKEELKTSEELKKQTEEAAKKDSKEIPAECSKVPEIPKKSSSLKSNKSLKSTSEIPLNSKEVQSDDDDDDVEEEPKSEKPPPLPKIKDCRTIIADTYYEMLMTNPEMFESLIVDNIEKNPDDCFKKAILFPLLEINPPKTALLMLIDSIDENYLNDGNLISTLKGKSSTKSRNIAELLSNHIHLLPKWLFLVCTAKKQNKHITKLFTGFKKLTLDDLRKSHVVKDVQQYIINRLNIDFRGINLNKEIIESLNQLYIKSNGCLLYLYKVLKGIKDNFFTFREIKMIPCTLYGLFLYLCQKSFNKKQYSKIRPILNVLLVCNNFVDKTFVFNCIRTHNYTIDWEEFNKRLELMKNILEVDQTNQTIKIFHNSFCDWLIDVKFSTKKFLCDLNEGHLMIAMYYTLVSDTLCSNRVREYCYHLIKAGEYLVNKGNKLDILMILLESKTNLNDCFYTNLLNCCKECELEFKTDSNLSHRAKIMIENYLSSRLNGDFLNFLSDYFKPNLPTDSRILKLLIETGINNFDSQLSCESSMLNSPLLSDKSQNMDSELAELLISSEKSCQIEIQKTNNLNLVTSREPAPVEAKTDQVDTPLNKDVSLQFENLDMELHKGKAFIHILANEGNHVLLERALKACKNPIDLEIEDLHGQTALNIAARNGHVEIVKLLLEYSQPTYDGNGRVRGVDVNHCDRDGWSPLRSASWGGHTEVVKMLISHPKCLIDKSDKEGRTALRAAAWSGNEDIVRILIAAGANVNSIDKQGRTSLIAASYMGHYEIVDILLDSGADVNHTDLDGRNALCVAALCGSSGYSKVISTLLEHGANTDQTDNEGMSPLLVSSFEGNAEICELLLENGADPDLADHMGRTPLWAACTSGHANVVKLLLFWGCGIDCMDSEGRTVLSVSAAQGNLETVRQLLDRGLDETHRDNAGWTPLHYAAFEGYADICVQLLESGAKIDECDNEGKAAIHLAAQEGHNSVIQALLEIHCACIDQRAHDGKTAFRLACLEEHFECIQTLLKYGCDVNLKDADSRTTLYILALENKLKVVKFLLEFSNVNVNIPDSEGRTAIHVASWQGHVEMVKMLITIGNGDVNALDLESRSPLHSCAWQGNHEVMQLLMYYGAIPDHACKQGATALGISAQEGHEECVSILLQYGANPLKSDHCGRTPIKLAAKSNRNNVLRLLESYVKNEHHPNLQLKSPDKPHEKSILQPSPNTPQNPNIMSNNIMGHIMGHHPHSSQIPNGNLLNATTSTQSSNFYENTMHSDTSSAQKRKSVISSQSTGSSNEAPISFTQQLQKHSRHHNSKNSQVVQSGGSKFYVGASGGGGGSKKHSQVLPNVDEYQSNVASNNVRLNEADLFDCMSPLYASPPHSPSSDLSSPHDENVVINSNTNNNADNHFARDTHMRIILGNNIREQKEKEQGKSKRSGIATNPAMRLIRNRIDSAANLIRRTNNYITSGSGQGSSSIGVKSGTFQWRKESQM